MEAARIEELAAKARFYAQSDEPWKRLHDEATACYQLERHVIFGIHLFDALTKAEAALRVAGVVPQDEAVTNALDQAWTWWLSPCKQVDDAIRRFESLNYQVEEAGGFRDRCDIALRRPKAGTGPGSWRHAVKTGGKLFGRPMVTKDDLRKKTGPFPDE